MGLDELVEWYWRPRKPMTDGGAVQELYALLHPRTAFLKMLRPGASVLDLGAGDGSLTSLVNWPLPDRSDLELHGYSLEKGTLFDAFASWELGDWDVEEPEFDGRRFDAVICSHFIEHLAHPRTLPRWLGRHLLPGGRVYVEWPSRHSLLQPRIVEARERGVDLLITHFHDDHTHRNLPSAESLIRGLERHSFVIEAQGIITLPWLEDQLMACFRDAADPFGRQAAFWLASAWSQYCVARKELEPKVSRSSWIQHILSKT